MCAFREMVEFRRLLEEAQTVYRFDGAVDANVSVLIERLRRAGLRELGERVVTERDGGVRLRVGAVLDGGRGRGEVGGERGAVFHLEGDDRADLFRERRVLREPVFERRDDDGRLRSGSRRSRRCRSRSCGR